MSTVNLGNQEISFQYKEPAQSKEFNKYLRKILKPGFYDGGIFSKINDSTVAISLFTCWLSVDTDKAVSISTTTTVNQTVLEATPILCLSFSWSDTTTNYIDWTWRAIGEATATNEIIVGKVNFSGGIVDGTFDYTNRTVGLIDTTGNIYVSQYIKFGATNNYNLTAESNGLLITKGDSTANLFHFTNSSTGTTVTDGFEVGIDASKQGRIWNYENTDLVIGTNNTARLYVKNDGALGIGVSSPKIINGIQLAYGATDATAYGMITSRNNNYLISNAYFDGGFKFIGDTYKASHLLVGRTGIFQFNVSQAVGVPNDPITWTTLAQITNDGLFGIGLGLTPLNPLHVQSTTTPQVRVAYDGTYYGTIACSSAGILTLAATGSLALGSGISSTVLIANTTECTGADTGALQVSGGAQIAKNLSVSGDLTDGAGVPVAGWLVDGTPYYIKEVSIQIVDTDNNASVAHGISNAYTNDRIFNTAVRYLNGAGSTIGIGSETTQDTFIQYCYWDDTNIKIKREVTTNTINFKIRIWYK